MKLIQKILIPGLLLAGFCFAQQKQSVVPNVASQQSAAQNLPARTASGALAEASNNAGHHEQGGENYETAQFKRSASLQFLARHLGITTNTAYWIAMVINFAIIAALIIVGLKKMLPAMFRARSGEIRKGMEDAQRASADANRRLSEIESKLARLGSEVTALQSAATGHAKDEEERLKSAAEEEHQKIIRNSEQEIAAAAGNARRELKTYVAELAVGLAEKKIKVEASTDRTLVRDFVEQLGRNGH